MSYKNSMKLFASNFMLVWKQMAYLACITFLFVLLSYTTINPIVTLLKNYNIGGELKTLFESVYSSPNEIALQISDIFKHVFKAIFENFSSIWGSFVGGILLCVILPYLLIQVSIFNISTILYHKFTMNMEVGYIQSLLQTLKNGIKYALSNILFVLPFIALFIIALELYLVIAKTVVSAIVGLVFLSAFAIVVISVKISVFSCYTAYMVEKKSDAFTAFGKGLTMTFKNFGKIFSISIVLVLTIIFINFFIALFTFFSGLIVTIPATFVLISTYNLVTYFNASGTRYYLSSTLIFNPVKYEVKKDDFTGLNFNPEEVKEIEVTTTKIHKKYKKNKSNNSKSKNKSKNKIEKE